MKLTWKASLGIAIALAFGVATPSWAAWKSFNLSAYPGGAASDNAPIGDADSAVSDDILDELEIELGPIETPVSFTDEIFQEPFPPNLPVSDGSQITQVPEPGSLALLTLGLGALVGRRRAQSRVTKA